MLISQYCLSFLLYFFTLLFQLFLHYFSISISITKAKLYHFAILILFFLYLQQVFANKFLSILMFTHLIYSSLCLLVLIFLQTMLNFFFTFFLSCLISFYFDFHCLFSSSDLAIIILYPFFPMSIILFNFLALLFCLYTFVHYFNNIQYFLLIFFFILLFTLLLLLLQIHLISLVSPYLILQYQFLILKCHCVFLYILSLFL